MMLDSMCGNPGCKVLSLLRVAAPASNVSLISLCPYALSVSPPVSACDVIETVACVRRPPSCIFSATVCRCRRNVVFHFFSSLSLNGPIS